MSDQDEIKELHRRLDKLEDAYNKHKKQRKILVAHLKLAFAKLAAVYEELTGEQLQLKQLKTKH